MAEPGELADLWRVAGTLAHEASEQWILPKDIFGTPFWTSEPREAKEANQIWHRKLMFCSSIVDHHHQALADDAQGPTTAGSRNQ